MRELGRPRGNQRVVPGGAVALRADMDHQRRSPQTLAFAFLRCVRYMTHHEYSGINRVTYDITSKLPGTIKWE